MSREIIFRGKAKTIRPGEWIQGSLVNTYDWYTREQHCFIVDDDYQDHDEWEVIPETVGQYTGLDDKNGKQIFEGDVLSGYNTYDFKVCIENGHAFIKWVDDGEKLSEYLERTYIKENDVVVIGNRWDNPELLVTE